MRSVVAAEGILAILLLLLVDIATPALAMDPESVAVRAGRAKNLGSTSAHAVVIEFTPDTVPRPFSLLGDDLSYDLTLGHIRASGSDETDIEYIHFGPTWHYRPAALWSGAHVEIGTAITRLSDDQLSERVLGGRWHFTSHLSLGHDFGKGHRWHAAIRLQHTSNASTQRHNPGLDIPMLEIGYHF